MKNFYFPGMAAKLLLFLLAALLNYSPASADRFDLLRTRETAVGGKILDIALSDDGKWAFVLTDRNEVSVLDPAGREIQKITVEEGFERLEFDRAGTSLWLGGKGGKVKVVTLSLRYDIDTTGAPYRGPEKAPVTMAVFVDYQ